MLIIIHKSHLSIFCAFNELTLLVMGGNICGMKKLLFCIMVLCALPDVAAAYVERAVAVLRVMDKDAGKVQELSVPVETEVQFEKLFINVRACLQTDPFDAEDFWGFIEISERGKGQLFGNWMSRNEPGQNPLQHNDYDVWLVRCE